MLEYTDSYKLSHKGFMNEGTTAIYSNFTPRTGKHFPVLKDRWDNKVVVFGVQSFIKEVLIDEWNTNFFQKPKDQVIGEYKRLFDFYLGKDVVPTSHFEQLHDLGYLPLSINCLPEGSLCPIGVPILTVYNTHPDFAWLTNYIETVMSCELWKPMTVATIIREYRRLVNDFAMKTTGSTAGTEFQIHGFEFRGMSGRHDAAKCGAAFLLSTCGTDTIPALPYLEKYYGVNIENEFIATSVPASEHSIASLGTSVEGELESYRKWITKDYPTGIVSLVSDTYDFWRVVTEYATELKDDILNRQPNELGLAKVVFRPDCYDDQTQVLTDSGFKFFKDLTQHDLVAQVLDDGSYEYVKPLKYVDEMYHGEMIEFKDSKGKVDLLVTPNHRMIVNRKGTDVVIEAEKMPNSGYHGFDMYRSAKQICKNTDRDDNLSEMDRLKIAFQADGSFTTSGNKIRFSFSKERKMNRLEEILGNIGVSYKKYNLSDERVEYNIDLDSKLFVKDFSWVHVNRITANYAQEFIEELSYWDATRRSDGRFKFDTTVKSVVETVELIALAAGYGVLLSEKEDNRKDVFSKVSTAHIMKNNIIGGQSWNKSNVSYSGKIYCVTVPTGKIIVKRNRCTIVCGNSGDPVKIICGEGSSSENMAAAKGAVECLWDVFGGTINEQGYKVLHERVGLIYGDSITLERANAILEGLEQKGFASTNVVFGVGSYTCQHLTRDSLGMAVKATYAEVDGESHNLFKDPVTDDGTKKSAKGLLQVVKKDDTFVLIDEWDGNGHTEHENVFINGALVNPVTFSQIRSKLWSE